MNEDEYARLKLLAALTPQSIDELVQNTADFKSEMDAIVARFMAQCAEEDARTAEMREYLDEIAEQTRLASDVEAAGWLPHSTTPFHLVVEGIDPEDLNRTLERYYRDDWSRVSNHFRKRLDGQLVDDEAKAVARQCLDAHGVGLFRLVPRALFPEIERVVRIELGWGSSNPSTSQFELRKAVDRLTPVEMQTPGWFGVHLAGKLDDHMYAKVQTSAQREAAEADPVPNRHAALHGIVTYAGARSSFNMLVMVDLVFAAVTAIKTFGSPERAEVA